MTQSVRILAVAALACLAPSARAAEAAMPSHMIDTWYSFEKPGPFPSMNVHFIWVRGPADDHIYEGFNFFFMAAQDAKGKNRAQGYMGPQIYKKKKRVLFSIWNAEDGKVTTKAVSGDCSKFDGEGDGIHCETRYDWKFGRDYRMTVERSTTDATGETYVGTIEDVDAGTKTEIGAIHVANVGSLKGYGGLDAHAAVFTEYVAGRKRECGTLAPVRVIWKGPFTPVGAPVKSKTIYPDACASSNAVSAGRPALIHDAGAGVKRRWSTGVDVWNPATPLKP